MPREAFPNDHRFLPHASLLRFEEITRAAGILVSLGVRKLRLTGGEPLLRKDIEQLVAQLSELRTPDGQRPELTLTTNGVLLARKARQLKEAGLQRVTVSLDALDPARFQQMSDSTFPVSDVLRGLDAAQGAGLTPVKVNMVVQKGVNDDQILPMARHFRHSGMTLRFIEFMDVGNTNNWNMAHVLPSSDVRSRIAAHWPLQPLDAETPGETAQRWAYEDGAGQIGFISSVTRAFCADCNRLRLSTDGKLFTCLFATTGYDLRTWLRDIDASDQQIRARLHALWTRRGDRYSELRGQPVATTAQRVEMSYIGG
jgi:cyclic pyranopterin phosphate synthase